MSYYAVFQCPTCRRRSAVPTCVESVRCGGSNKPHAEVEMNFVGMEDDVEQQKQQKPASGLWRRNPETPEGKYLVKRRDGTVPEWPSFVLGARDPAAPAALRAYAAEAERLGYDHRYVSDVLDMAVEFETYRLVHGSGDPDRARHRPDDPETIEEMRRGRSA